MAVKVGSPLTIKIPIPDDSGYESKTPLSIKSSGSSPGSSVLTEENERIKEGRLVLCYTPPIKQRYQPAIRIDERSQSLSPTPSHSNYANRSSHLFRQETPKFSDTINPTYRVKPNSYSETSATMESKSVSASFETNPTKRSLRALIVDDTGLTRLLLAKRLQAQGVEVMDSPSAIDAIKTVETAIKNNKPFDFIVMDYEMSGTGDGRDGDEATEAIRELEAKNPDTPKAFIIGNSASRASWTGLDTALKSKSDLSELTTVLIKKFPDQTELRSKKS